MNSFNKIKFSSFTKVAVLILQTVFLFGFSFSQNSVHKCCHVKKETTKHSCCSKMDSEPINDHCTTDTNSNSNDLSISHCNCIHSISSKNQDVTVYKTFELTKYVSVLLVDASIDINISTFSFSNSIHSDKINGPPIFIAVSTLLI